MFKRVVLLFVNLFFITVYLNAQTTVVADKLLENGKLNAVFVVVAIILIGIFIYLFRIEKKINRLEQEQKNNNEQRN